ncbi:MAG: amidase family protein, partial [Gemmatimonadota bacterium]|nr:amidase family protein [Gemmatimonadota bacterium]
MHFLVLRSKAPIVLLFSCLLQACSTVAAPSTPSTAGPRAIGSGAIDVVELTVQDIQTAYAAGEFTAVEVTTAFLDQIDHYEDHYNALISMNPDALAIAAALDEEYASTGPRGPLHG